MILDPEYDQFINEQLTEVFALPVGLKPIVKLDGQSFYGSEKLNTNFLKALAKNSKSKPFIAKFQDLIERKQINPMFLQKGIFRFLVWKIFAPAHVRGLAGFYEPDKTKSVYILLSNNANIFGHVSNKFMAELTIHECIHMLAGRKSSSVFLSLFRNHLTEYYKSLWSIYFKFDKSKIKDDVIFNITKFLLEAMDKTRPTNAKYAKYYNLLQAAIMPLTSLDENQFSKFLLDYILFVKLYTTNLEAFYGKMKKYNHVSSALYGAYKDAFGFVNKTTLCVQELIYPSEIVAMYAETKIDSKIKAAIKMI